MKKMFSKQKFLSQVIIYTLIKYDFFNFLRNLGVVRKLEVFITLESLMQYQWSFFLVYKFTYKHFELRYPLTLNLSMRNSPFRGQSEFIDQD